jgi:hypothetical protein
MFVTETCSITIPGLNQLQTLCPVRIFGNMFIPETEFYKDSWLESDTETLSGRYFRHDFDSGNQSNSDSRLG